MASGPAAVLKNCLLENRHIYRLKCCLWLLSHHNLRSGPSRKNLPMPEIFSQGILPFNLHVFILFLSLTPGHLSSLLPLHLPHIWLTPGSPHLGTFLWGPFTSHLVTIPPSGKRGNDWGNNFRI